MSDAPIIRNGHNFVGQPHGGGRFESTPAQLRNAALRLAMKTRMSPATSDHTDPGTDAALVATAYLDLTREDPRAQIMEPSIQTITGEYFNFLKPEEFSWDIEALAHGLAYQCRFTGHTRFFYSIALHSVLASYLVEPEFAFEALMHDSHEFAYGDMATPLKILCPDYRRLEDQGEAAMRAHYGLPAQKSPEVKRADLIMLATEKRDIMPDSDHNWGILKGVVPCNRPIGELDPEAAKRFFLNRFAELQVLR